MAYPAHHSDETRDPADSLEPPVQMSPRQRLEWEVAQLADGTLSPERRSAVEAALVSDAQLRTDYAAHRRLNEMLRQAPPVELEMEGLTGWVMRAVAREPAIDVASVPARKRASPSGSSLADALRGWWVTISAAAAALLLGLSMGVLFFASRDGSSEIAVTGPRNPALGEIQVIGPDAILRQQRDAEMADHVVAMDVTGPDYHAILDPQGQSTIPGYALHYGGPAVVETPGRMIVASADGSATGED